MFTSTGQQQIVLKKFLRHTMRYDNLRAALFDILNGGLPTYDRGLEVRALRILFFEEEMNNHKIQSYWG